MIENVRHLRGLRAEDGHVKRGTAVGGFGLLALLFLLAIVGTASAAPPTVTINPNPTAKYATAEVSGTVDPGSQEVYVIAEYRPVGAGTWNESPIRFLSANEGPTPISHTIEGVQAGNEYEARLDARVFGNTTENFYSAPPNPKFKTKAATPPTITIEAPTAITATSAHFSGHINPNSPEAEPASPSTEEGYAVQWHFECKTECFGEQGTVPADNSSHLVASDNSLRPGNHYEVRLVGENAGGPVYSEYKAFVTPPVAPEIERDSVENISSSGATFVVFFQPGGAESSVSFQYVTTQQYVASGFAEAGETPPVLVGGGNNQLRGSFEVSGLGAGNSYYFRPVVTNSVESVVGQAKPFATLAIAGGPEAAACPNEAFRSGLGAFLPDCRAYEQVSPTNKGGVGIEGLMDTFNASSDGSGVTFYSQAFTGINAGGGGHQTFSTLLSTRDGESWSTQRLAAPESLAEKSEFLGTTANDQYAFVEAGNTLGGGDGLYSINTSNQSIETVVPPALHPAGFGQEEYGLDGTSADGSQVFFETRAQILPEATEGADNLYLWRRDTGELSIVGVLSGSPEKVSPTGSFGGAYAWFSGSEPERGGALVGYYVEAIHAISPDGDQIYFTAANSGQLYLRTGLRGGSPTTVQVSAPVEGEEDPEGTKPAAFQEATPDGSRAFFLSSQKLTPTATTGPADEGRDLYRWEKDGALVDIAPDTEDPNGAEVLGLLGVSNDGSSGYFVAKGHLADGGTYGAHNIYRFEPKPSGVGFAISYVAPLSEETNYGDALNWSPRPFEGRFQSGPAARSSRVTPDGKVLLFTSTKQQRGYENAEGEQLYRYDSTSGDLFCISCSPTGAHPKGPAELSTSFLNATLFPESGPLPQITRNMTPDGDEIFFQSPDALVPRDLNSQAHCGYYNSAGGEEYASHANCVDVYEWEASGASASCPTARVNGGCLFLLSSGTGTQPSNLIDESADGDNVFIATASQLVPIDHDSLYDIYDVRVNGGVASQQAVQAPPCVSGESCRGLLGATPPASARGTESFQGPGNPKAAPPHKKKQCKKGKKRCHKAKRHRRSKHRKHRGDGGQSGGKHRQGGDRPKQDANIDGEAR